MKCPSLSLVSSSLNAPSAAWDAAPWKTGPSPATPKVEVGPVSMPPTAGVAVTSSLGGGIFMSPATSWALTCPAKTKRHMEVAQTVVVVPFDMMSSLLERHTQAGAAD